MDFNDFYVIFEVNYVLCVCEWSPQGGGRGPDLTIYIWTKVFLFLMIFLGDFWGKSCFVCVCEGNPQCGGGVLI